jgi:DNA invertase Pin-like site-specific DNA recombinase
MIGAGFLFGAAGLTGICQPLTALDRISRRCLRDITAVVATTSLKMSISTSRLKRPELDRCLSSLKKGDTLVIYKLDRLGRSVHFLLGLVKTLGDRGINRVSLNDPTDTTTPVGVAIFQFCAVMAELEKGIIR